MFGPPWQFCFSRCAQVRIPGRRRLCASGTPCVCSELWFLCVFGVHLKLHMGRCPGFEPARSRGPSGALSRDEGHGLRCVRHALLCQLEAVEPMCGITVGSSATTAAPASGLSPPAEVRTDGLGCGVVGSQHALAVGESRLVQRERPPQIAYHPLGTRHGFGTSPRIS
jgi:hypothetical protein